MATIATSPGVTIEPARPAARPQLASIQVGRIIAMVMVMVSHTLLAAKAYGSPFPPYADLVVGRFSISVDFFLTTSGFIIYYVTAPSIGNPDWLRRYAHLRLSRVYIAYLPVAATLTLVYLLIPGIRGGDHYWTVFSTVTLLPSSGQSALFQAWTLHHELIFFIVLAALLAARQVFWGMLVWAAAILVYGGASGPGQNVLLSPINLDFIFGVAAAWCVIHGKPAGYLLPLIALCLSVGGYCLAGTPQFSPLMGLASAALLVCAVRYEAEHPVRLPRRAAVLADASYCIYLVHVPLLSGAYRLPEVAGLDWISATLLCVAASMVAGTIYHVAFERPALARYRRLAGSRRAMEPSLPAP